MPTVRNQDYEQQFSQDIQLFEDETYTVTFDAYASSARPIGLTIGHVFPDYSYTDYIGGTKYFLLETEKKRYSYTFTLSNPTDPTAKLGFNLGKMEMTLGDTVCSSVPGDVYIDNIRVNRNMIRDGQFNQAINIESPATPTGPWNVWWGDVNSGEASGSITSGTGKLDIHLLTSGNQSYSPHLFQEGLYFEQGRTYRLTFEANSTEARKMMINIGKALTADPWFIKYLDSNVIDLNEELQIYTVDFQMNQETFDNGKLVFELGRIDGQFMPSIVTLSNISMVRLE